MKQKGSGMLLKVLVVIGISILAMITPAQAEWSGTDDGNLYYTDDVALFSATRRSNIDGKLTDNTAVTLSVQRANRRQNFDQTHNFNTNVGVGVIHSF